LASGRSADAIYQLTACLATNPYSAQAYHYRAIARSASGDHKLAIGDLDKAIQLTPGNIDLYQDRASQYLCIGAYKRASEDIAAIMRLRPQSTEIYRLRAFAELAQNEYTKCIGDCNAYLNRMPTTAPSVRAATLLIKSRALLGLGKQAEALEAINEGLLLQPSDAALKQQKQSITPQQRYRHTSPPAR
ncbi:MAG TPA: hypothetical protein V6D22_10830, partial [Candidatus Obscuribacterales bacterium]